MLGTSELHISILPDVFTACCLLQNYNRINKEADIEQLMRIVEEGTANLPLYDQDRIAEVP
jgi:hypothetical protein